MRGAAEGGRGNFSLGMHLLSRQLRQVNKHYVGMGSASLRTGQVDSLSAMLLGNTRLPCLSPPTQVDPRAEPLSQK